MYAVPTKRVFVGTRYIASVMSRLPDYFVNRQYRVRFLKFLSTTLLCGGITAVHPTALFSLISRCRRTGSPPLLDITPCTDARHQPQ